MLQIQRSTQRHQGAHRLRKGLLLVVPIRHDRVLLLQGRKGTLHLVQGRPLRQATGRLS